MKNKYKLANKSASTLFVAIVASSVAFIACKKEVPTASMNEPDDMWLYFYPDTQQRRTECLTPETETARAGKPQKP